MSFWIIEIAYLVASALFVMSLYWMNDPKTARRGVGAGVAAVSRAGESVVAFVIAFFVPYFVFTAIEGSLVAALGRRMGKPA